MTTHSSVDQAREPTDALDRTRTDGEDDDEEDNEDASDGASSRSASSGASTSSALVRLFASSLQPMGDGAEHTAPDQYQQHRQTAASSTAALQSRIKHLSDTAQELCVTTPSAFSFLALVKVMLFGGHIDDARLHVTNALQLFPCSGLLWLAKARLLARVCMFVCVYLCVRVWCVFEG